MINSGQQTLTYQFDVDKDLTVKADVFISKLDDLETNMRNLNSIVRNQLQTSAGHIVEEAMKTIEHLTEKNCSYYAEYKNKMKHRAEDYHELIMQNNRQKLTLYYDINIENNY